MPKTIRLIGSWGLEAIVDDDDFEYLNQFKWYLNGCGYAARRVPTTTNKTGYSYVVMHRDVMKAGRGQIIDHKNRNKIDNRKENLRFCTASENMKNRKGGGSCKYLGVYVQKNKYKLANGTEGIRTAYIAKINTGDKQRHIGSFQSAVAAALAYDREAKIHHKEFANLNFPDYNINIPDFQIKKIKMNLF